MNQNKEKELTKVGVPTQAQVKEIAETELKPESELSEGLDKESANLEDTTDINPLEYDKKDRTDNFIDETVNSKHEHANTGPGKCTNCWISRKFNNRLRRKNSQKVKPQKRDALSINELTLFLNAAHKLLDFTLYGLIYTAFFTGMRRSELLSLRWSNVEFEKELARPNQQLTKDTNGELHFTDLKTVGSEDYVALPAGVLKILRQIKEDSIASKESFGPEFKDYGLVFCNPDGTPLSPDTLRYHWNKVRAVTKLDIRLHDARLTHATLLSMVNAHRIATQKQLRYAPSKTTLKTSAHFSDAMQHKAVQNVEDLVRNAIPTTKLRKSHPNKIMAGIFNINAPYL